MKLPIGSYSFYNQLINCPHQAFHRYVGKTIPYVQSPEAKWGDQVHQAMERRIGSGATLPDEMQGAENVAQQFHQMAQAVPLHVEYKLAMTAKGEPCDYQDWDHVWFRGKLDCVLMNPERTFAWMVDWKTGNVREDPFELECGGLLLKINQPSIKSIKAEYFWMKVGSSGLRYTINQFANTFEKLSNLRQEAETYLRAGEWPKRKTPLCGWCDVTSCEHNTKHKRK